MKPFVLAGLVSAVALTGLALAPAGARAESRGEVEAARANARAGGPVSEHDKWLLERYGALSGTPCYRGLYGDCVYAKRWDKHRWKRRHY